MSEINTQPDGKTMPPVRPSTIIIMVLFALMFTVAYYFSPYLLNLLPFYGKTVRCDSGIAAVRYEALIKDASFVVLGTAEETVNIIIDRNTTVDGVPLVYTEHRIKVQEVLGGDPSLTDGYLVTYTLGGTVISKDSIGRPSKVKYVYTDAASLGNEQCVLFLDSEYNLIAEKYGLYKKHGEELFYDAFGTVYSVDDIKSALREVNK